MTSAITRKSQVREWLETDILPQYLLGVDRLVKALYDQLLTSKVKFPLLEYAASALYENVDTKDHITLCDGIAELKTIGGNVLIGIILQKRLSGHFEQSMEMAAHYIAQGEEWYVTDIIGERVYGVGLLMYPDATLKWLRQMAKHESHWVVRAIGAGSHYAIKKGLDAEEVEKVFKLLLSLAIAKHHQIKTGIGWAAKTTARFHQEVIAKYRSQIENKALTGQWFRTKVSIGLARGRYTKGSK
ncbi:MAG: DNA alkylation repair protein [Bacteroidota bacterium]